MSRTIYKTYFSHDIYARQDRKIKNLLMFFRKESDDKAKAAVCIYWWIIEDMHADDYKMDNIEVYADDYRCDVDFLKSILEDFELFRKENDCYISDRVLRNIKEQEEKSKKAKRSVQNRWKDEDKKPKETPRYNEINSDDVFVAEVMQSYKDNFNDSKIISNVNKQKIADISNENKLKIEDWQKVFSNAKRGWDYPDGRHIKPSLKKILEDWDSFHRGDNGLAPEKLDESEIKERKRIQKEAGEKLDSGLDTEFFIYEEYRCSLNATKLQAQQVYNENLSKGNDEAIKAMVRYLRSEAQDA